MGVARRRLGRNSLEVSELGFGTAPLGDLFEILDDRTAVDTASTAIQAGMTLVDTSPHYGQGLAEHRLGTAIRRAGRDGLVISTKVGRWMRPARGEWDHWGFVGGLPFFSVVDYSYDGTMRSIEQSLIRLCTDHIDIALIHDVDRRNFGDQVGQRFQEATTGAWKALAKLRDEKVIRAAGIGVNEWEICMDFAEVCDLDCVLLAGRYSLLDQSSLSTFMALAETRGIGVLLGGVFNSGILATGPIEGASYDYAPASPEILEKTRRIAAIAARHGVPLPVAAMQFVRHHPAVSSLVLGAVTADQVKRNLDGWNHPVPDDLWAELKREGLIDPDAPVSGGGR